MTRPPTVDVVAIDTARRGMKQRLQSWVGRGYVQLDRRPRLTVVTLHRVGPTWPVTPAHVRHHLGFLAEHSEFTTPATLPSSWEGRRALITIDDCHGDTYTHIYPIARALGVPFTICVPTDYFLHGRWLWFDHLYWLLDHAAPGARAVIDGCDVLVGDAGTVVRLKVLLKRKLPDERAVLLASLENQFGLQLPPEPCDGYEPVTFMQMREMLDSGLVELCAHTQTHTIATVLPDVALQEELAAAKRALEAFSGREVASFCYPNGRRGDFDDRTTSAVRSAGYGLAFVSDEGTNVVTALDRYQIRRIHAHRVPSVFEKEAAGFGDIQRSVWPT